MSGGGDGGKGSVWALTSIARVPAGPQVSHNLSPASHYSMCDRREMYTGITPYVESVMGQGFVKHPVFPLLPPNTMPTYQELVLRWVGRKGRREGRGRVQHQNKGFGADPCTRGLCSFPGMVHACVLKETHEPQLLWPYNRPWSLACMRLTAAAASPRRCLQQDPKDRMNIHQVVKALARCLDKEGMAYDALQ